MRYNTNNPLGTDGSSDPRDMYDNAGNFDFIVNSRTLASIKDRFNIQRTTLHGYGLKAQQVIDALGMYRLEGQTFGGGAEITSNKQLLFWPVEEGGTGWHYYWSSQIPTNGKVVPPGSTPASTGGTGTGGWFAWNDLENRLATGSAVVGGISAEEITQSDIRKYNIPSLCVTDFINAAISATGHAYVPHGVWNHKGGTVVFDHSDSIYFENSLINADGINFSTFILAPEKSNWAIKGRCIYLGSLTTSDDVGDEIALKIVGGDRYYVENFIAITCRSHGILIAAGLLAPAPRGDQGKLVNCGAHQSRYGFVSEVHASTEFCLVTNFDATGNLDGIIAPAGNSIFNGGNCVENVRGYTLLGGPNHAHGITNTMNIDHNQEYDIMCIDVTNGHTFNAIHAYNNGGVTGGIIFQNCKGVVIQNGKIDGPIYNYGTVGQNAILNNHMPGSNAQILGSNPEYLRVLGNFTDNGSWIYNDPAAEFVQVSRGGTAQPLSTNTTLVFNNAIKDKRSLMNLTDGTFPAPIAGIVNLTANLIFTATGLTVGQCLGYITLLRQGTTVSYAPVIAVQTNLALCNFAEAVLSNANDEIYLKNNASATSLALAVNQSRLTLWMN